MGPIIVDTSVWIDSLRGVQSKEVELVSEYMTNDGEICITPTIIQEVLQGIREDKRYETIKAGLLNQRLLLLDPIEAAIGAAQLYRVLRKQGVTIRKPNDCMIAHYAIAYELPVVHNDSDFTQIAQHTALQTFSL